MPIRRRLAALFVLYLSFPLIAAAQLSRPENVMVDGKLSEWANPLPNYDKVTKLYYDIHNDPDFLYIALKRPESAEKIKCSGRILLEVCGGQADSSALKIIYPATKTQDETDMWNYLEVSKAGSRATDTVTIYNDYGIQAGGRFWTYEPEIEKNKQVLSPFGGQIETTPTRLGTECELAIPRKLLPAATGSYVIQVILRGESAASYAKDVLRSISGARMPADELAYARDIYTVTTLTIHYNLK